MKKIFLKNFGAWIVFSFGFLLTAFVFINAADLVVTSWTPLTASGWNSMVSNFFWWSGSWWIYYTWNVWIWTTSPNKKLHIYDTTTNAEIDLQSVAWTWKHWAIYHDSSTQKLNIWNGSNRFSITTWWSVWVWWALSSSWNVSAPWVCINWDCKTSWPTYSTTWVSKSPYTHVISLKSWVSCPSWYEDLSMSDIVWTNGRVYALLNKHWLMLSSSNWYYAEWHEIIRFNIANTTWPAKLCKKTYTSYSTPHITYLKFDTDSSSNCPSWYTYLSNSRLAGNNGRTYTMSNDGGSYIWYIDQRNYAAQATYNWRYVDWWHTSNAVKSICYRIDWVEENPATKNWVFPVMLWVNNQAACTNLWSDWFYKPTSSIANGNYLYNMINDNLFMVWHIYSWAYWGENYIMTQFHTTHVSGVCIKLFPFNGEAIDVFLRNSACPTWYTSIPSSSLVWWNDTGYMWKTKYWMYVWWLYTWWIYWLKDWYQESRWTGSHNTVSNVCIKTSG